MEGEEEVDREEGEVMIGDGVDEEEEVTEVDAVEVGGSRCCQIDSGWCNEGHILPWFCFVLRRVELEGQAVKIKWSGMMGRGGEYFQGNSRLAKSLFCGFAGLVVGRPAMNIKRNGYDVW